MISRPPGVPPGRGGRGAAQPAGAARRRRAGAGAARGRVRRCGGWLTQPARRGAAPRRAAVPASRLPAAALSAVRRTAFGHRGAGDESFVQRGAPERVGIRERLAARMLERPAARAAAVGLRPVVLDDRHAAAVGLRRERAQELVRRSSFVERRDQRLRQRDGAVERRGRRPSSRARASSGMFQWQCGASRRRGARGRRRAPTLASRSREPQIHRRGEDRVAAHDHQQLDLPGVHRLRELGDRRRARGRRGLDVRRRRSPSCRCCRARR